MAPWQSIFTEERIWQLVAFIRALQCGYVCVVTADQHSDLQRVGVDESDERQAGPLGVPYERRIKSC